MTAAVQATTRAPPPPPPPPPPDSRPYQCHYFLPRKGRYCSLRASYGNWCGEHVPQPQAPGASTASTSKTAPPPPLPRRIPCPYDRTHTTFEHLLDRHLSRCNARPTARARQPQWFEHDANVLCPAALSRPCPDALAEMATVTETETETETEKEADRLRAERRKARRAALLAALQGGEALASLATTVESAYDAHVGPLDRRVEEHEAMDERLEELTGWNSKHAKQQGSLLGHARKRGWLSSPSSSSSSSTAFVEFGCGRAELSRYLYRALDPSVHSTFVLVDRGPARRKHDVYIREGRDRTKPPPFSSSSSSSSSPSLPSSGRKDTSALSPRLAPPPHVVQRLRTDIKDLRLAHVDAVHAAGSVVGYSKHLCGSATDLTLESLRRFKQDRRHALRGFFIALCCHHRCTSETYVGRDFLRSLGLQLPPSLVDLVDEPSEGTVPELEVLSAISSWWTSGDGRGEHGAPGDGPPEAQGPAPAETPSAGSIPWSKRRRIGLQAKRLLDAGRLAYVRRELGLDAELVEYVPPEVSLENGLLIAWSRE